MGESGSVDGWERAAQRFVANGPIGLMTFDARAVVVYANEAALEIIGRDPTGMSVTDLLHADDLTRILAATKIQRSWADPSRNPGSVWRMLLADGGSVEVLTQARMLPVDGESYLQIGFLPAPPRLTVLDTLHDVAAGRPLSHTFARLMEGIVSDVAGMAINWMDPEGQLHVFGNLPPVLAGVGRDGRRDADPETPWWRATEYGEPAEQVGLDGLPAEVGDAATAAGFVACCVSPVPDPATGESLLYVNWVRDASMLAYVRQTFADVLADVLQVALVRAEDARRLYFAARHDHLTGLANRGAFFDALTAAIGQGPASVLYLDLDGFKLVNDHFGHDAGDQVLVAVAERLEACVPGDALVARLGGDEFAIVVPGDDGTVAEALAVRVVDSVGRPFALEPYGEIAVSVSVGCSVTDGQAPANANDLVVAADEALRSAKGDGKGTWVRATSR
ncbi:MAG: GGDEF domain-containing protein [Acidimicrobiales bacterium]|nr:GGDEF domain-containing protein [Acidimicrobiales bacterium]